MPHSRRLLECCVQSGNRIRDNTKRAIEKKGINRTLKEDIKDGRGQIVQNMAQ